MTIQAVFFDLDGTLLDTALDLANALNVMLDEHQRPQLPIESIRCVVSDGANALLKLGFGVEPGDSHYEYLRATLLDHYANNIALHTRPFAGIETLINKLTHNNISWGIVTNKPWAYTEPLMKEFAFASEPVCTICPDHVTEKKPAPDALLLACKTARCQPRDALYIGDHERDIECGRRAGMDTIAVGYGYLHKPNAHTDWGATHCVDTGHEIWPVIQSY